MLFIAIDFGISYIKICLIDEFGKEKLVFKYKNLYEIDNGVYKEINLNYSFEKVIESIGKIKETNQAYFNEVKSISVSTHGNTFVLIDKSGKELTNGISVFDKRADIEAGKINSIIDPEKNYNISGISELSELYAPAKILWLKNNKRSLFKKIHKILFVGDYFIFRLTGKFIIDKSLASITGMFNILKGCWRKDILNILELDENKFSEIVDSGIKIGPICQKFVSRTGLNKNVNVVTGMLDGYANSLGSGNIKFDKLVECTGTVLSLILNTKKPEYNKLKIPIIYFVNNIFSLNLFSPTAGVLLDWFGENFYNTKNYYNEMEKDASSIKLQKDNILFLPYFIDAGSVNKNIRSRGLFFGLNLNHKKKDFCRSIYESIGFILKENIMALESVTKSRIESVSSVGGASKSSLLSQIKCDILNKKIVVTKNKEVGCLGVSILSAVANKTYKDLDEACKNMVEIEKIYYPDKKIISIYEERYRRFKNIFNNIKELFINYY